ncbi:MAG: energy transducer TonB [Ignavibacteriaceae bacterium]|jgi:protein TonB|nr:energy transducer TonB [Ignavibacteriaceae bacterium]MCU0364913.1 energy transducer TonB [Ignavibacteriaceae bacterium]MCU0406547.1 energy transducer TonB [Ignavibacteriaceae bacterium]MCU0413246.1 energy transducer TonB [Ignavibacteriaceae bacterium]
MSSKKSSGISYAISLVLHAIAILLFLLINLSFDYVPSEYIDLSFGISDQTGSSGAQGNKINIIKETPKPSEKEQSKEKNPEVKEVDLPIAVNTENENVIKPANNEKELAEERNEINTETVVSNSKSSEEGNSSVEGNFGFDIDWGGKGTRKIYSFILPQYPEGVKKEVNIKLRFTILPDGTVGTIVPVMKADTRLENAAINSLRQWRFEALSSNQRQSEQTAVIVFPYRLQ